MPNQADIDLYNELLQGKPSTGRGAKPQFTPEVAEARQKEQHRRHMEAKRRALRALQRYHAEDYARFLDVAKAEVESERPALPGDESSKNDGNGAAA